VLARQHGLALTVVDCGVKHDFLAGLPAGAQRPGLLVRKADGAHLGTADASQHPAMSAEQCAQALRHGVALVQGLPGNALLLGEMGIGNTSAAALLLARLTGLDIADCTGAGTGLDDTAIAHKTQVLRAVLVRHADARAPLDVLAAMGGFEIATRVGAVLQAGAERRVLVVDGFIASAAVLVAQAYLLGRRVARSPWGGVLAALLLVVVSEVSFASTYNSSMFLGLFVRWLFVSPTFFFGMIYCGALLLAVDYCTRVGRCTLWHIAWLALMAAAGTGAKGTLLPVMLCAMALWFGWRWARERRLPLRLAVFGVVMGLAFAGVYYVTMSSWRTGDAAFRPFHVFELTEFWKTHLPLWKYALGSWLPETVASPLATLACAAVVFAGTCGVRLLAIPYLFMGGRCVHEPLVGWLGAFFFASAGMGMLMQLNSYGELYLILMIRLPMAALAAAFIVDGARRLHRWHGERVTWATLAPGGLPIPSRWQRAVMWSGVAVCALALTVQASLWLSRNRPGFALWLATPPKSPADDSMRQLHEALLWVRKNTERDAVLVTNAFTLENMKKDHWGALDQTLAGVHFYYSAISERRLWFEGHNYIMDTTRARLRANMASAFFYHARPLDPAVISPDAPSYAVVDRSLSDGARVNSQAYARVFSNARIEIYELSRGPALASVSLPSDRD
jgi:hypothetical protein